MIDLRVYGEPGPCREKAADLRRVVPEVADTAGVVRSGRSRALSSWRGGQDAWLFGRQAVSLAEDGDSLEAGLRKAAGALETFADELTVVRDRMAQAREMALAGGLTVSGDRVLDEAVEQVMGEKIGADAERVRNEVGVLVHEARTKEVAAHQALRATLEEASPASLSEIRVKAGGVVPVEGLAEGGYASMSTHASLAGGSLVTEWATRYKYGTFYADALLGRHAKTAPGYVKFLRAMDGDHWQARPGQSVPYARWVRVGKVVPGLSAGLSGAAEAYQQWRLDEALHPEMENSEQVARTATVGIWTGGLSFGGEVLGSTIGGTAGAWSGPGGAVAAFTLGTVGGIGGAELGEKIGDASKDDVGEFVGSVTDSDTSFGDAVTFWD